MLKRREITIWQFVCILKALNNTQRVMGGPNTLRVVDFTDIGIADYRIALYRMYVSYTMYH